MATQVNSSRLPHLDALRGFLLVWMAIDHCGGLFTQYTWQPLGFFSAAEAFFALSGWVGGAGAARKQSVQFLLKRARLVYLFHIGTFVILLAWAALANQPAPPLQASLQHPWASTLLACGLLHWPDYLDVLPLYVLFLSATPLLAPLVKRWGWGALAIPGIVYLLGNFGLSNQMLIGTLLPSWTSAGTFNPFTWQILYAIGFVGGYQDNLQPPSQAQQISTTTKTTTIILFILFCFVFLWRQQILSLPLPAERLISRNNLGVLRLLDFLLAWWLLHKAYHYRPWRAPTLLCMAGRNSLEVFSLQILLVYAWLFTRHPWPSSWPWIAIPNLGMAALLLGYAYCRSKVKEKHK